MQSELNIIANITDNQAIYRCEAQNSATDVPLLDSKTLSVHCEFRVLENYCSRDSYKLNCLARSRRVRHISSRRESILDDGQSFWVCEDFNCDVRSLHI